MPWHISSKRTSNKLIDVGPNQQYFKLQAGCRYYVGIEFTFEMVLRIEQKSYIPYHTAAFLTLVYLNKRKITFDFTEVMESHYFTIALPRQFFSE